MRTREVTVDQDKYTIAALTLEQVEQFIAPIEKPEDGQPTDDAKTRAYQLVCYGLNNAHKNGDPNWTKERVYKELDLVTFLKLQQEILELSGLRRTGPEPGEPSPVMQ